MPRFAPMTLANMRQNSVRAVIASRASCGRSTHVNVDLLPETLTAPETGQRLRCSAAAARRSQPDAWHTGTHRPGTPDYRRERPPLS